MNDPAQPRRRQGFWLTVGEIVAVLGLLLAGLNYWDSHQQQKIETRKSAAAARAARVFVITGEAAPDGRKVTLHALQPSQAIQSQRYHFPTPILAHPMEVTAAQPQIDLSWIEGGLRHSGTLRDEGEATLPVAIVTTFIEDGETLTDVSLYRLGYNWRKAGLLGGAKVRLEGIALIKRGLRADPRAAVDAAWSKPG